MLLLTVKNKRAWNYYAAVVRLQQFDEEYKTTFLSAIGKEALEIYEGMRFNPKVLKVLNSVVSSKIQRILYRTLKSMKRSGGMYLTPDHRKRTRVLITMYWT